MRNSRSRARSGNDRWSRTYRSQSRTGGPHDCFDGPDERLPGLPLLAQDAAPLRREPVEASAPLTRFLNPAALDPAAVLEAEQRGVERWEGKRQLPARAGLDQLADLVSVARTSLEQRQDEHFAAALFQLRAEHVISLPICSEAYYNAPHPRAATAFGQVQFPEWRGARIAGGTRHLSAAVPARSGSQAGSVQPGGEMAFEGERSAGGRCTHDRLESRRRQRLALRR